MGNLLRFNAVLTTAILAATLSGCTDSGPTAEDAARELAAGLAKLDVSGSAFTTVEATDVTTDLATITAALDPLTPEVTVESVESTGDDAATARLDYLWDVDASDVDWTYSTTANLTRGNDEWQVVWDPSLFVPDLEVDERLESTKVQPERAEITSAEGAIVTQRPVVRVGIDKVQLPEAEQPAAAAALAELVDIDPVAYAEQVAAAGAEAFVEAIVLRDDASRTVTDEQIEAIPGALVQPDTLALAPTRTFARELLGSVGEPSAELIEQSGGTLAAGVITGLSGLQLQHNDQLAGTPGLVVAAVSGDGAGPPRQLFEKPPVEGTPLAITLDPTMQTLAEQVLADEPSASSIVAIRPSSGEILTVANGPGSKGLQTALLGQYPPGSTFKVATSLALLREGFTPDTATECPAELDVEGRTFKNASTYPAEFVGTIPLLQTFAQSCNTGFISNRDIVSQPELAAAAADLGIGIESAIGLPAFFGSVPAEAEGTAHAAAMIGQGEVLVSPLALATMTASVGNGARVTPTLLAEGQDAGQPSSASPSATADPGSAAAPSAFTSGEAETLRTLMRAVVTEGGAQLLSDVPGEPVRAKTGTAEFGSEDPPRTHAWIVALQGDLAVAVFVEEGELGSTSGGPLMEAFLRGLAP